MMFIIMGDLIQMKGPMFGYGCGWGARRKKVELLLHVLCLVMGCKLSHSIPKKLTGSMGDFGGLNF